MQLFILFMCLIIIFCFGHLFELPNDTILQNKCYFISVYPIPVAARSKAWVCGRSLAGVAGSNPARDWMFVCCECCVLSGVGFCVELITRPEESHQVVCLNVIVKPRP